MSIIRALWSCHGVIGVKKSLQSNELINAWTSKLGDKGSLSDAGLKVCGFGSLCQTWVRITGKLIIHYITFTEWEKRNDHPLLWQFCHPRRKGKGVCLANWLFWPHCWLDTEEPDLPPWAEERTTGLNYHPRQEWGLFLLEHLLHYTDSMRKKEHWRHSWWPQTEGTKEAAPKHPFVRALLGTTHEAIIQVAEQICWGQWTLAPCILSHHQQDKCMREL